MEQLLTVKRFLVNVWLLIQLIGRAVRAAYFCVRAFLQTRVPFVRALIDRHSANPSTLAVDVALFLLAVYFIFGVIGFVLVYPKKSDSKFTQVMGLLYPMPAARIDDSVVWSHQFTQRVRYLDHFNQKTGDQTATKKLTDQQLRGQVLDGLIENKLIYLEAKKRGVSVSGEEITVAYANQGKPEEVSQKIAELYGMSESQFKTILGEQILKDKVKTAALMKIRLRHILVTTLLGAQDAKRQISGGKSFADAAKEFSQDAQSKDKSGDLGYWYKGELAKQISPGFEEVAFKQKVDEVSDLIQTQYGFHILQVTEKTGDNYQSYDEWLKVRWGSYKVKKYITP